MDEIERRIILTIADLDYPFRLKLGGKQEELTREAARLINESLNTYRKTFPNQPKERYLAMVAFDFCFKWLEEKDRNDVQPYKDKIQDLLGVLDAYFQKE